MTLSKAFIRQRDKCRAMPMGQSMPSWCWRRKWRVTCDVDNCREIEHLVDDNRDRDRDERATGDGRDE